MWLWLLLAPSYAPPPPRPLVPGLVRTTIEGVDIDAPGPVRVIAPAPLDLIDLAVAPDGSAAVSVRYRLSKTDPVEVIWVDLHSGTFQPVALPVGGWLFDPQFLEREGPSWRVVVSWSGGPVADRGLYTFRLDDPAGTWTPWAVTGTMVRQFFLVEDRRQLLMLSYEPDGKSRNGSDRLDVAPIVGGHPDLTKSFRIAPEIRDLRDQTWDARADRFVYHPLPDGSPSRAVALTPGAVGVDHPGLERRIHWNPNRRAPDAVYAVDSPGDPEDEWVWAPWSGFDADAVSVDGEQRPLLRCGGRCAILAFSPVLRELFLRVDVDGHEALVAARY